MDIEDEFTDGVNAYWAGEVAEGWDNPDVRNYSPYIMGWYLASLSEVEPWKLRDRDGNIVDESCRDCGLTGGHEDFCATLD